MYDDYGDGDGDGIKVWGNPGIKIELSQKNVNIVLQNKTTKNGFTLVSFNNIILRGKLTEKLSL